jgi:maltooligosyltrehalose trehalohydrolase
MVPTDFAIVGTLKAALLMKFGAELLHGTVRFRLWAPKIEEVLVLLNGGPPLSMNRTADGWHELVCSDCPAGTRYKFRLERGGPQVPDPASRCQPEDVHGPSEVIDPHQYVWLDRGWRGRPWEECVLYELHVGTFTTEGTFLGAIDRLDWLANLGVTAIEIMPVADFPGKRNWGYDGVMLFAPDSSYGRPDDFKALIDAAHARGIMVLLDVVYNHFGPDGNYLPSYSPIFTERHHTPWGAAVNFDSEGSQVVREFVIENAVYWIEEFHLDGLRLDAIHAIKDDSTVHVLEELSEAVRQLRTDRHVHLILENEENEASRLDRNERGKATSYTAQWNDDLHHALHCAASGERSGYYGSYAGDTDRLGKALAEGFAYQGDFMSYRGSARGEPSSHLPPTAFVSFMQNHDQVGNRAFGDRITSIAPQPAVRAIASIYLLLPQIPMIFMGEEFGADQPFPFFCDFEPELATRVREGRRAEFAKFPEFQDPARRELIPDPTSEQTFNSAKLNWECATQGVHADWVRLYQELLAIRRREIVPLLKDAKSGRYEVLKAGAVSVVWQMGERTQLHLLANLNPDPLFHLITLAGRLIWSSEIEAHLPIGPWGVRWSIAMTNELPLASAII